MTVHSLSRVRRCPLVLSVLLSFGLSMAPVIPAFAADDDEVSTLREAVQKGDVSLTFRYRVESVDDDGRPKDAFASTLRTTLALSTARWRGFQLVLEGENVWVLGDDDGYFNAGGGSLSNAEGAAGRAVVADPELTEVNQAYLDWKGAVNLRVGRQEINLGDQRFVGAVGWRQNHQSFDALRLDRDLGTRAKLTYSYIENVNRIFGDNHDLDGHLLWVPIDVGAAGTMSAYGIVLDYEDAVALSSRTVGVELAGSREVGDAAKILWEVELANQEDFGDRTTELDADYLHGMFGFSTNGFTFKGGLEVLGADPGNGAFRTPLATLHKFNGWADRFLATPAAGLEDLYVVAAGPAGPTKWLVAYHDFQAESASIDYGRELDAQLTWKSSRGVAFGAKAALYEADEHSADVTKIWAWASTKF